jgi:hypothetical protein
MKNLEEAIEGCLEVAPSKPDAKQRVVESVL